MKRDHSKREWSIFQLPTINFAENSRFFRAQGLNVAFHRFFLAPQCISIHLLATPRWGSWNPNPPRLAIKQWLFSHYLQRVFIPGSSKCVKFVPFHPKNQPKGRKFTKLEDPGIFQVVIAIAGFLKHQRYRDPYNSFFNEIITTNSCVGFLPMLTSY